MQIQYIAQKLLTFLIIALLKVQIGIKAMPISKTAYSTAGGTRVHFISKTTLICRGMCVPTSSTS
jgi:hypothetical protein